MESKATEHHGHVCHSESAEHMSPNVDTGHMSPSTGAGHITPSAGAEHMSPSTGAGHITPSAGAEHMSPSASARYMLQSESAGHMSYSESAVHRSPSAGAGHMSPPGAGHRSPSAGAGYVSPPAGTQYLNFTEDGKPSPLESKQLSEKNQGVNCSFVALGRPSKACTDCCDGHELSFQHVGSPQASDKQLCDAEDKNVQKLHGSHNGQIPPPKHSQPENSYQNASQLPASKPRMTTSTRVYENLPHLIEAEDGIPSKHPGENSDGVAENAGACATPSHGLHPQSSPTQKYQAMLALAGSAHQSFYMHTPNDYLKSQQSLMDSSLQDPQYMSLQANISNQEALCRVCGDKPLNHLSYGVRACKACASFFEHTIWNDKPLACTNPHLPGPCPISKETRNLCSACRFIKCVAKGMRKKEKDN